MICRFFYAGSSAKKGDYPIDSCRGQHRLLKMNLFEQVNCVLRTAMKRIVLLILLCLLGIQWGWARHIKGGWVQYEYVGPGAAANTSTYKITVYVFRDCSQAGPMPSALGIYDAVTYANVQTITGTTSAYTLQTNASKTSFDPCLSNPPTICYQIYTYSTTVTLNNNTNGYLIVAQDAFRVTGIVNIVNSVSTGISFTATIPGVLNGTDYHVNTSPFFSFTDTAIICYSSKFIYQYKATDADGDRLTYSLDNGINGTQNLSTPPYTALSYTTGYSGTQPLGPLATIDSLTGLISGTAPATTGEYVIAVYVHEWRNGVKINSTRKELQITVGNCSLSAASLKQVYLNCNDYSVSLQNESASSNITSYLWDFGVSNSSKDTSTQATPVYSYADTGTYTVTLTVGNSAGCKDSAKAPVKIYPGFSPSFTVTGSCYQSPFSFTNTSLVKYGTPSWAWDFGDSNNSDDTSSQKNPSYRYSTPGIINATLSVTSSIGCSGSFTGTVVVNDKPYINLPFKDTLICSIDTLPLIAQSTGTYLWSPNKNISNINITSPKVFPKDTTVYTVTVTDQGCIDSAKIQVNVLPYIRVSLGLDTGICKTDSITLRPVSDALSYRWRESVNAGSLNSYAVKYPKAAPGVNTTYYVTANLGYCQDSAKMTVYVSPYPVANAGRDTAICYGSRVLINGSYTGSTFSWSSAGSLINSSAIQPVAGPSKTTAYILTVKDTLYCPKTVNDTVIITVIPRMNVDAGKDTAVTLGQPLQLNATGADASYSYSWSPTGFLDNSYLQNPVATITDNTLDSIRYTVRVTSPEGCTATDNIKVLVYRNGPDILVPSAFTPNGDGRNDILKPILFGISQFEFFAVYNRWGQQIFYTTQRGQGWDGNTHGVPQSSGGYVYISRGQDFTGKTIFRKGTVVLIR
jgi:gliding motility-associated-like protein